MIKLTIIGKSCGMDDIHMIFVTFGEDKIQKSLTSMFIQILETVEFAKKNVGRE